MDAPYFHVLRGFADYLGLTSRWQIQDSGLLLQAEGRPVTPEDSVMQVFAEVQDLTMVPDGYRSRFSPMPYTRFCACVNELLAAISAFGEISLANQASAVPASASITLEKDNIVGILVKDQFAKDLTIIEAERRLNFLITALPD